MYVYAVTGAGTPALRLHGVQGERLGLVRVGTVAAVVGRLSRTPAPTTRNLRRHHLVVETIAAAVPALLPARFGTLLASQELRDLLGAREATFRRALQGTRGRAQMTVRFPVGVGLRRGAPLPPGPPMDQSGAAWLRARARAVSEAERRPECLRLRAAVRRWVRSERISVDRDVLTVYHLVPRSAAGRYRRAVADLGGELSMQLGGPYPPFAFVPDLLLGSV